MLETGLFICLTQNTGRITNSDFEFLKSEYKYWMNFSLSKLKKMNEGKRENFYKIAVMGTGFTVHSE